MTISIVIPAYNEEKYIGDCLKSIIANRTKDVQEIIVVCNACTDSTEKIALSFPGVTVVHESKKGITHARQCGFLTAKGDILAYIDADARIRDGWLQMIEKEFNADPTLSCLSGPYEYYDIDSWQEKIVHMYFRVLVAPAYFMTKYMALGGNFVTTRKALESVNGFDTSIEFYGEDTDIARRLSHVGTVKFSDDFVMMTSGRRLKKQGILQSGMVYAANFVSEVFMHQPMTKTHKDIR